MTIKDEFDQADSDNKEAKNTAYWTLRVCPECGGNILGHWRDAKGAGAVCWMFHHIEGEGIEVQWPEQLTCRICGLVESREEVRKRALTPYNLKKDATHSCGRHGDIDSSD